jgi:hypothetical protein
MGLGGFVFGFCLGRRLRLRLVNKRLDCARAGVIDVLSRDARRVPAQGK